MQDEAGGDEKIIAVPVPRLTRRYEKVLSHTDLPEITLRQIDHEEWGVPSHDDRRCSRC